MRKIFNNFLVLLLALIVALPSCKKDGLTDGDQFMLFYPDVSDIGPGSSMTLQPTYHGPKPQDFKLYNITFNGEAFQTDSFRIDPESGNLSISDTKGLQTGVYSLSISCQSNGQSYEFPDMISVNMMNPIPASISVKPSLIELLLTQVNDVNSEEILPTAQVTTDGDHISITSYSIAKVTRDGTKMTNWNRFFAINKDAGLISIIKNSAFVAGEYVFDLRLITSATGAGDEEGLFASALKIKIYLPPMSLSYEPESMEAGGAFTSKAPVYSAASKNLVFELKAVSPDNVPLTINSKTGVLSLAAGNSLKAGDRVEVSVRLTNEYGTKDFDQVATIDVVDDVISQLAYNDSTVWHSTAFVLRPTGVDGSNLTFSFVDLPSALSELTIDEATGAVSAAKGNKIEKGNYTFTVKVANEKGEKTDEVVLHVIDNPYFFTKVSWGNNLGLTPVGNYASQHRVSVTEDTKIAIVKSASDITDEGWTNVKFSMVDGNIPQIGRDAVIDAATGEITTIPSACIARGTAYQRTYVAMIEVTVGEGTSGVTTRKVPVFFDFNAPHSGSGYPTYIVEFTPFVFQCNPKTGGSFVKPVIKYQDGTEVGPEVYSDISMTFLGTGEGVHPYYWNLDGPATHLDGNMSVTGGFLYQMWTKYYTTLGKTPAYSNVNPLYSYHTDPEMLAARLAYMKNKQLESFSDEEHLRLYVAPEKWVDDAGQYADGVFMAQVRMGFRDNDGTIHPANGKEGRYQLYPFLIWFDTEF